jgi:tetratricopeptide (TPR) repeat protein
VTAGAAPANSIDSQICDSDADYFLEIEDYARTIRSHEALLKQHPDNALAHYHLGFAYGMAGRPDAELHEYLRAIDLGLTNWDLFLNLGLAYLDNGSTESAIRALYLATIINPIRPEAHFNLALAYERAGRLDEAKEQVLVSIGLDSRQAAAWNTLATIYAEQGDRARARKLWCNLVQSSPGYIPARSNLRLLEQNEHSASLRPDSPAAITSLDKPGRQNLTEANESESMLGYALPPVRDANDPVVLIDATNGSTQPGTYADSSYSSQVLIIPTFGERK